MTRLSALAANEYFAQNPAPEIQRSTFDRSAGNKFDFSAGKLIPFYADEILPGDTFFYFFCTFFSLFAFRFLFAPAAQETFPPIRADFNFTRPRFRRAFDGVLIGYVQNDSLHCFTSFPIL